MLFLFVYINEFLTDFFGVHTGLGTSVSDPIDYSGYLSGQGDFYSLASQYSLVAWDILRSYVIMMI